VSLADLPRFADLIRGAAARYGLDPTLVGAIALRESALNPSAFNPADPRGGAYGLMQVLLGTARDLGYRGPAEALFDPALSLDLGSRLLAQNIARAGAGGGISQTEIETRAIAAYNAGWSKARPGDAPRAADGSLINAAYVDLVRRYQLLLASLKPALSAGVLLLLAGVTFFAWRARSSSTPRT
jgi:soluble lytic murein transglycosylase-like protein